MNDRNYVSVFSWRIYILQCWRLYWCHTHKTPRPCQHAISNETSTSASLDWSSQLCHVYWSILWQNESWSSNINALASLLLGTRCFLGNLPRLETLPSIKIKVVLFLSRCSLFPKQRQYCNQFAGFSHPSFSLRAGLKMKMNMQR